MSVDGDEVLFSAREKIGYSGVVRGKVSNWTSL